MKYLLLFLFLFLGFGVSAQLDLVCEYCKDFDRSGQIYEFSGVRISENGLRKNELFAPYYTYRYDSTTDTQFVIVDANDETRKELFLFSEVDTWNGFAVTTAEALHDSLNQCVKNWLGGAPLSFDISVENVNDSIYQINVNGLPVDSFNINDKISIVDSILTIGNTPVDICSMVAFCQNNSMLDFEYHYQVFDNLTANSFTVTDAFPTDLEKIYINRPGIGLMANALDYTISGQTVTLEKPADQERFIVWWYEEVDGIQDPPFYQVFNNVSGSSVTISTSSIPNIETIFVNRPGIGRLAHDTGTVRDFSLSGSTFNFTRDLDQERIIIFWQ